MSEKVNTLEPGTVYGNLEVVSLVESSTVGTSPSRYMYKCKCLKCGEIVEMRYDGIKTYGKSSKCKCKIEKPRGYDTTSLIGQKFGDLTVIAFGHHEKGKDSFWLCECKCGNRIEVRKNNLTSGNSTRCRRCADKIVADKNHTNQVYIGERICNCDDPDRYVTITGFDHYDPAKRKHYYKWHCEFCGNDGVTSEYGLRNYEYICNKCASVINIKKIQPKFARLTPIKLVDKNGTLQWLCKCDCGNTTIVNSTNLTTGAVQSCGCIRYQEVKRNTPIDTYPEDLSGKLRQAYFAMISRCYNPNCSSYERYSSKGIKVCDRWLGKDGCKHFIEDMGPSYIPHLELDRINNDKDYSPDNCRWTTNKAQQNNRDNNRSIVFQGKEYNSIQSCLDQFIYSGDLSLSDNRSVARYICSRLNNGWTPEQAIMIPPNNIILESNKLKDSCGMSYRNEFLKIHSRESINKLDKPINNPIVFYTNSKDIKTNYFDDNDKDDPRAPYYNMDKDSSIIYKYSDIIKDNIIKDEPKTTSFFRIIKEEDQ